jgi:hypothetical protein
MKLFAMVFLASFMMLACNKTGQGDIWGQNIVKGKVYAINTYENNSVIQILPNVTVYLSYPQANFTNALIDTTSGYLYTTTTDSSGGFTFANLSPNQSYQVYAVATINDSVMQNVLFSGLQQITPSSTFVNLQLVFNTNYQNLLYLSAQDAINQEGLAGCKIGIYTSYVAAYTSGNLIGSSFKLTSDSYGNAFIANLNPNLSYFVNAIDILDTLPTIQTNMLTATAQPIPPMLSSGISPYTIYLK